MWTGNSSQDESDTPGWISMADALILATILLVGLTFGTSQYAAGRQRTVEQKEKARQSLLEEVSRLKTALKEEEAERKADQAKHEQEQATLEEAKQELEKQSGEQAAELKEAETKLKSTQKDKEELKREFEQTKVQTKKQEEEHRNEVTELMLLMQLLGGRNTKSAPPNAKLTIRISCSDLPDDLDLDLYVQDPKNRMCFLRNRLVKDEQAGLAILVESEDRHKFVREETIEDSTIEESFYALDPIPTGNDRPYLLFCMLRGDKNYGRKPLVPSVTVDYEIKVQDSNGNEHAITGSARVDKTGQILITKDTSRYPGLTRLTGFTVNPNSEAFLQEALLDPEDKLPRGWSLEKIPPWAVPRD